MKVIAVSTYLHFHQIGLWNEVASHKDLDFTYLATGKPTEERKKMNYQAEKAKYAKNSFEMSEEELAALFKDVDIVIYSQDDEGRVKKYIENVKHVIVSSEHLSKRDNRLMNALGLFKWFLLDKHYKTNGKKHLLAMSSHAYDDFKPYGFKGQGYRFGYFPLIETKDEERDPYSLIWFGRLLKWKRVDLAIEALKYLVSKDNRYHLTIIGEGEDKERLLGLVKEYKLENNARFEGFYTHEQILEALAKSSIHMFTSNRGEGWGVALNEGLASGCLCIANEEAGSSRFLIDGNNGFLFKNNKDLINVLDKILSLSKEEIDKIRDNAKKTINETWNYKVAASRLYEMLISIYNHGDFDKYQSGPVSKIK